MDKPIDALITNTFERRIREVDRITREFKAPQVTSGASGQLGYAIENTAQWDRTETLPYIDPNSPPFIGSAKYRVTFTGDGSQENPMAIPLTDIRVNGTGEANKVTYRWNLGAWAYGDPSILRVFSYDKLITSSVLNPNQLQWEIDVSYSESPTIRFKLRAQASSPGTLSIVRVS